MPRHDDQFKISVRHKTHGSVPTNGQSTVRRLYFFKPFGGTPTVGVRRSQQCEIILFDEGMVQWWW